MLLLVLKYEWKSFIRNKFQMAMLIAVLSIGFYSIFYGYNEIEKQRITIQKVRELEAGEFQDHTLMFKTELTSESDKQKFEVASSPAHAWHRHGYHALSEPTNFAAIAIGQRDIMPYYYRLTALSLYYQLFENEIANPMKLYVGNLDLSFVLIYIFPLIIIAFTYSLLSSDQESGVFLLVRSQPLRVGTIVLYKLMFYAIVLVASATVLLLTAFAVNDVHFLSTGAVLLFLTTKSYLLFWFALAFLIIALQKSSAFNAMTLLGLWLMFLIVVPAIVNMIISNTYPLNSATIAGIVRRNGFANEDDEREVRKMIRAYLQYRPEYSTTDTTYQPNLMSKAYAGFTELNDKRNKLLVDKYFEVVRKRQTAAEMYAWTNPAIAAQNIYTNVAATDVANYHQFHYRIFAFHEKLKRFYFPKLFLNVLITEDDYKNRPSFEEIIIQPNTETITFRLLIIMAVAGLISIIGLNRFSTQ